jgi:chorismate mutase
MDGPDTQGRVESSTEARSVNVEIADWRRQIDQLDEQIVALLNKRAEAAKAIGAIKQRAEMPVYEPQREQDVFNHVAAVNPGPLNDEELIRVYERLMDVMRRLQRHDA